MGLMLARIGGAMSQTTPTMIVTGTIGAGVGVGATNGIAYGYGKDLSRPQTRPEGMNHAVGIAGGVFALGGGFGSWIAEAPTRTTQKLTAFGLGASLGAYALAPFVRRAIAED